MVAVKAAQISESFNDKTRLAQYHSLFFFFVTIVAAGGGVITFCVIFLPAGFLSETEADKSSTWGLLFVYLDLLSLSIRRLERFEGVKS